MLTPTQRAIALIRGQFSAGQKGLWWESSPFSSLWQDSAGTTPVTAVDDPVGKILDKSGRGNHALQATAGARPTIGASDGIQYLTFDGTDDGMATAAFAAGTLTSDMDCFIAVKRNSASGLVTAFETNAATDKYFGVAISGSSGLASNVIGVGAASTYFVNGTAVPGGTGTTRGQLHTAMPVGEFLIVEVRNLNLSSWLAFVVGSYVSSQLNGNIQDVILLPAQTDANRATIRKYLGAKVGLAL